MPDQYKVENTELDGSLEKAPQSSILSTIVGLVVSNSSILCYIFMIVAHIINGSLISLVYPVSIF